MEENDQIRDRVGPHCFQGSNRGWVTITCPSGPPGDRFALVFQFLRPSHLDDDAANNQQAQHRYNHVDSRSHNLCGSDR